jgi:hypothetical protein
LAITGAKASVNIGKKQKPCFAWNTVKDPAWRVVTITSFPPSKDLDEQNEGNENERRLH